MWIRINPCKYVHATKNVAYEILKKETSWHVYKRVAETEYDNGIIKITGFVEKLPAMRFLAKLIQATGEPVFAADDEAWLARNVD